MNSKNNISFASIFLRIGVFLLFIILLIPVLAHSQQRVQIVNADSIVATTVNGMRVQKIIGNVHLKTQQMEMFADRAYKYPGADMVKAFGNIQINTGKEMIWADTLIYYTDIDFAKLRGRVIIKSDSTTLFSNAVDYRFTNNVAHFLEPIRLVDRGGVLTANRGFYFRQADSAAFRGRVQLRDSLNYAEGKYLFSNRAREYYELHEKVFAFNYDNNTKLSGNYLETDSTGRSVAIGNAWLINFETDTTKSVSAASDSLPSPAPDSTTVVPPDSLIALPDIPSATPIKDDSIRIALPDSLAPVIKDSTAISPDSTQQHQPNHAEQQVQPDTTHIWAHKIVSIEHRMPNDTTTTVKAYRDVRIWSPDFSAVSDSARYQSKKEVFELWGHAKIWYNQIQLSSPYIWVKLKDGEIKKLIAHPQPFVVRKDTVIDRLNQIKGDTLKAFFTNGSLQRMVVYPHSHLLRFTRKNGKPDGAIELTAPKTIIYFENGKLTELKSLAKDAMVSGYYRPKEVLKKNKRLSGFSWDPKLRPQKPKKPMKRRLPPIPDEPPFPLPKRYLEYIRQSADSSRAQ